MCKKCNSVYDQDGFHIWNVGIENVPFSQLLVSENNEEVIRVFPSFNTLSNNKKNDILNLLINWANEELLKIK